MRRERYFKRLMVLLALVFGSGCSETRIEANYTGINLRASWTKNLQIATLPFRGLKDDGTDAFTPGEANGETATGTGAISLLILPIALDETHVGETIHFEIDGLDEDGNLLAVGSATATLRLGELFPMNIRLTPPNECGDGTIDLDGTERCDDQNQDDQDGCDADCQIEAGWICARAPSICFPERMTVLADPSTIDAALADGSKPFVILRAGTYTDPIIIEGISKTIVGQDGATLEVDSGIAVHVRGFGRAGITGLDVRGGSVVIEGPECSLLLKQMIVGPSNELGVRMDNGGSLRIERSEITGNAKGGVLITSGLFHIENSIIRGNGGALAALGGILVEEATAASTLTHNTIVENVVPTGSSTAAGVHCKLAADVANSIIWGNNGASVSSACVTRGSDIGPVSGGTPGPGAPSISADPKLSVDLHLLPGSPCIDSAEPSSITAVDIDGDARPAGDGPDMGADETN